MQSESQPTRPPRLTRTSSKDATSVIKGGLLMSVIRTLTSSRDSSDRDREKANLEREFKECDHKLSELVVSHHHDLFQVMSAFSKISQRLKQSRERVVVTRDKLQTCQKLLHCKRDELKKLWLESIENKVVLELLDRVETMMTVPQNVDQYIQRKHYLHATRLVVNSLKQMDTDLVDVDALKEVKSDLIDKKESLYELIVDELHKHLYIRSTTDLIKRFKRHGSVRHTSDNTPARKMSVADILSPALQIGVNKKQRIQSMSQIGLTSDDSIEEDINVSDPEEDSKKFISILIKCLALLNKIPESIDIIKERCDKELTNMAKRTGRELTADAPEPSSEWTADSKTIPYVLNSSSLLGNYENKQKTSHILQNYFDLLFQQYRTVVFLHDSVVLANLQRLEMDKSFNIEINNLYTIPDIWTKVQIILQYVMDLYLDTSGAHTSAKANHTTNQSTTSTNAVPADLSSYFVKRRGITAAVTTFKAKKAPLFRFEDSSHAISLNAYLAEQKETLKDKNENEAEDNMDSIDFTLNTSDKYIVYPPQPDNIVVIFNPMIKFIREIEDELELEDGNHCLLYLYLISSAKSYCNQITHDLERTMDLANKSLDIWKLQTDSEVLSNLGLNRPILHSTAMIDRAVFDLKNLMFALPLFADDFLTLICNLLSNYKEICFSAYKGIVQPEPEDKRIISATWAKDEDINRFLKSLPNWSTLLSAQSEKQRKPHIRMLSQESRMTFDESPEEVRLRNMRESEILTSNLSQESSIPNHEILSDVVQLRILGQLHQSMEWLGKRCDELVNSLPQSSDGSFLSPSVTEPKSNYEFMPLSDVSIATLNQLSRDFEELAETCLLVLHLEVRVHCFYHILPISQSSFAMGIDTQEPDPEVIRLNKDLSAINEALDVVLEPWKLRYIFEGVGHLVATILINTTNNIKRVNSNGVKKMCRNIFAIQQSLTTITMSREVALDYARQYFELFYHTIDEILTIIVEKGAQFQLNEYMSAITLLHRSITGRDQQSLDSAIKRLTEILNEVAVSL
ncbi:exocyst complex component 4-like [Oppia nitens]|uniref:exocyst complex component 4-like n=1 Tax=Oppia nitens TaxID=1686743 RepID=UPI0023DCB612|nr:exocyst complex component 4-like [Oppia nitens]